jgi:transposase-like protein
MKEMFKDVVQEVLEAEMDEHLGYEIECECNVIKIITLH